ncbi:MAG: TlpA disulfide reductase family protein [Bacteroidota bacterium]
MKITHKYQPLLRLTSAVVLGYVSIYIANQARVGELFINNDNLSQAVGLILSYLLLFIVTATSLKNLKDRKWKTGILFSIVLVILFFVILKGYDKSIKYTLKISPFYISVLLGVVSGYFYVAWKNNKLIIPILFLIFPFIMSFGGYNLWLHRVEYGNFFGSVDKSRVIPFELINKEGEVINNESLKGKVVLFDFWYISCNPCWVKFPELQRTYEKYQSNPMVEIYAVNRPMKRDKQGELFTRIEKKNYTFPVLQGTQEIMDSFDVYVYPTVILLNREGEVVFMGELEDAEKTIQSLF